ncbi:MULTISPECIES: hypothetical protein [Pseudanabaena]|uniref:Uncharacterized protein n=2 Tax=Pseudanabaena TaxID=1152 RepID=L8MXJ0_9CYAN|nr:MULTISPECIES: hypothetical protein [Pseudanabaena]ELS30703.1 hypothetical protein Pse7429DRAFT_4191 [Pseudanabaena biceps PCC 7429]MDG3497020.1 hypothetical protein [Pseudanabaena catenata USMAC16]
MSGNVSLDLPQDLLESIQRTRTAAIALAKLPSDAKNNALEAIAVALEQQLIATLTTCDRKNPKF